METSTVTLFPKYEANQKFWLTLAFIITSLLVATPSLWIYQKVKVIFGIGAAELGLTAGVIFLLAWTTLGVFAGLEIDWMMQEEKFIFNRSQKNKGAEILMLIWGHTKSSKKISASKENLNEISSLKDNREEVSALESKKIKWEADFDFGLSYEEVMSALNQPNRRGRPPRFGLDKWIRVAIVWESRDTTVDAFTLAEVISDVLGTNADGSPAMSEQSYYKTWRGRAKKELKRIAKLKKERESKISKQM